MTMKGPLVTVYRVMLFTFVFFGALVGAQGTLDPASSTTTSTDVIPPPLTPTISTSSTDTDSATLSTTDTSGLSSITSSTDVSSSTDSLTTPTDTASSTSPTDSQYSSTTASGVTPPPLNPSSPVSSLTPNHSSHAGAIAGGVVGGLVGLGILAGLLFLYRRHRANSSYRGRSGFGGTNQPPSPRLNRPWLGIVGMRNSGSAPGTPRQPRPQRLGSVGGESTHAVSPSRSNSHGHGGVATSDDAHELGESPFNPASRNISGSIRNGVAAAGAAVSSAGRHRSSTSRTSYGEDALANNSPASYDLNVFNSSSNVGASRGGLSRQPSDPFGSETSISIGGNGGGANGGASELSRGASGSRLARKPAPKYDEDSEPSSPVTPISPSSTRQSKPPVSGPSRMRTYSNSSSMRAQAAANAAAAAGGSSGRSSLEAPQLPQLGHKGSQGTLGGAFKFAGEKEGPVHYLIPDPPVAPSA